MALETLSHNNSVCRVDNAVLESMNLKVVVHAPSAVSSFAYGD